MTDENRFIKRYRENDIPWDLGRPDFNLTDMVTQRPIDACNALEIGCGTGDNAIWLAQQAFKVTATDISEIAIAKSREKAAKANVKCNFVVADFLKSKTPGAPFGFVFDRGCFHTHDSQKDQKKFAAKVAMELGESGLWLSLIGSADDPPRDSGPPRFAAAEVINVVEPYFEILALSAGKFDSNEPHAPRIWVCLMRKRNR